MPVLTMSDLPAFSAEHGGELLIMQDAGGTPTNGRLEIQSIIDAVKAQLEPPDPVVICPYCHQVGIIKYPCPKCGAPLLDGVALKVGA